MAFGEFVLKVSWLSAESSCASLDDFDLDRRVEVCGLLVLLLRVAARRSMFFGAVGCYSRSQVMMMIVQEKQKSFKIIN